MLLGNILLYNAIKKLTYNIISYILNLGFHDNYLLCCTGDSGNNILDNIYYFSDDNSDNNGGSTSNSNDNSENAGDSTSNSNDNSENAGDSTSNSNDNSENNRENNENFNNNNSNGDRNIPEEIVDDLDIIDRARKNDPEALEYLKGEYGSYFDKNSTKDALNEIEEYLEDIFPSELKKSEHEADAMEARAKAKTLEEGIKKIGRKSRRDNRSSYKRKSI
jgi:hypothetical protein